MVCVCWGGGGGGGGEEGGGRGDRLKIHVSVAITYNYVWGGGRCKHLQEFKNCKHFVVMQGSCFMHLCNL